MMDAGARPGAVALVGSGEYTAAMDETDAALLATVGGVGTARVALLPTASGLEVNGPTHWNSMGLDHFAGLGVADVRATQIVDAASAASPLQLELLRDANFFYFSGGDPAHIIATLRGSPAWELIAAAHARGAVLAGCSAGAMMLGGRTLSIRSAMASGTLQWGEALGVVPGVIVFPHFDRMASFAGEDRFRAVLDGIPADLVALGVDEDTALVRLAPATGNAPARWRVMGRQTVTVFAPGAAPRRLGAGDEVEL
jgi:cyanophycinase